MAINRVDFGGNTLIDLTGDTLESAEQLLKGIIAHAKDGSVITGLMEAGGGGGNLVTGEVAFESDLNLYNQSLTIDTGLVTATAAMIIAKNDSSLPSKKYIWILLKGVSGLIKLLKKEGAVYGSTVNCSLENGILNINNASSYLPFAAGNQYFWAAWEA